MKRGILRVVAVNLMCFSLLFYCGFSLCESDFSATTLIKSEEGENVNPKPEKKEENPPQKKENESSQVSDVSSLATESEEKVSEVGAQAVKGKIISQYNSPYTAKEAYSDVYLKNNTELNISIKKYLEAKLKFNIEKSSEPQVLILHTHATETFKTDNNDYYTEKFNSRSRNNEQNMISVGKIVAEKLNSGGIVTLHDTTLHDYPSYSGSYSRSAETVKQYIKKYPSIKVVLDLHRDAVSKDNGDKVKLVTEIEGKKAAQVMLVMGSQSGSITNFPNWEENFKLAVKLQQKIEQKYPTLARPIMLMSKNYNQSLTDGSLLIEFGTDVNTLEEVHYSAEMVGNSLVELLSNLK